MSVFVVSSLLNYLDRSLLTALGPRIAAEFHLDAEQFGWVISAFSLPYALAAPLMGLLMDAYGMNVVICGAMFLWSLAGAATGVTKTLPGLVYCRVGLGVAESAGIPAVAKAGALYLPPEERALGSATSQIGISAGLILAPTLGVILASRYGWRAPFYLTGALGTLWIPVWLAVARVVKPSYSAPSKTAPAFWDWRLGALMIANVLWMGLYAFWFNWLAFYLVNVQHMSLEEAAWYSWVPPVASSVGAIVGGALAMRWIRHGSSAVPARLKVLLVGALGALLTLTVPLAASPAWATVAISVSIFAVLAGSVNLYVLPVDLFGPQRTGFAIAALGFSYGILQTVISPAIGHLVKLGRWETAYWALSPTPLLAWLLLRLALRQSPAQRDLQVI